MGEIGDKEKTGNNEKMGTGKTKKRGKRWVLWTIASLFFVAALTGVYIYRLVFQPISLEETTYVYIMPGTGYKQVVEQLKEKGAMPSEEIFLLLAERMNYPNTVKSGRYAIEEGMTMPEVIRRLRSGNQAPVNLTFNNIRAFENLAGRLSQQLMLDSLSLLQSFRDSQQAEKFGFNPETFPAMFIPNSYEVYWNTSIDDLLIRMKREYDRFWNETRKEKAKRVGLTLVEVSILASIVEEEATYSDEYPTVAGLYLNRLKRGMRLEADPTVKFAVGDFTLRRVLFRHLEVESLYNTYKHGGLPPGPIRMPSIKAIDGVLNPEEHNYLFMCAKEDLSGRHNFATTHAEHARNAAAYQRALNERGIY